MSELYDLLDYSTLLSKKKEIRQSLLQDRNLLEIKIAVLCGGTFGTAKDFLEIFLLSYGIKPNFFIGDYNRYYEEACFENPQLKEFSPDFILVYVSNKNLMYYEQTEENHLTGEQDKWRNIWNDLHDRYHCSIIQNNFEYYPYRHIGNGARALAGGNIQYVDAMNELVSKYAQDNTGFYICDINYMSAYVGLANWFDDRMWYLYKYPMAMAHLPRYALNVANIIKAVMGKNKKTLITDLDNTLWGGVIGELGAQGIELGTETPRGHSYTDFQKYLKDLSKWGIVLNIASKNNYQTGIQGLQLKKSVLREDDFVFKEINWEPKGDNIAGILTKLNLLPEAAVFLDDNDMECDSVKGAFPQIEVIQVKDVKAVMDRLDTLSYYEMASISSDDRKREQYYKDNRKRELLKKQYASYEEYLDSLHMECIQSAISMENMERVVQLLNKTNQFNFMTNRYSIEQMEQLSGSADYRSYVLRLEDKFGDNGIIAVALVKTDSDCALITDWVMSCRVFGRNIEKLMLHIIAEDCMEHSVKHLYGCYRGTEKNKPIADFYDRYHFAKYDGGAFPNYRNNSVLWECSDLNMLKQITETNNIILRRENHE